MATIPGTNIPAKVVPFTTDDQYPTHEDIYGQGGMMTVADIAARDAIPAGRRKQYMKVAVIADGVTYELSGGVENSNWKPFGPIYYQQATEPTVAEKTFVFWRNSSTNKYYLVTKINSIQKKVELDNIYAPNWTSVTGFNQTWSSIAWSPQLGLFVAVASSGTNRVMTSPNGINWTLRTSAADSNNWSSICWSLHLGIFVAVSATGTGNQVMTSPDGINWTSRTNSADKQWISICWSFEKGLFVAIAQDTGIMTSPDGINWTNRTSPALASASIAWSPQVGLFVAVSGSNNNNIMTSPDGINWTLRANGYSNAGAFVMWAPSPIGLFIAVSSNQVMTSPDGITWTARITTASLGWRSVAWSPELGLLVAVATVYGGVDQFMTSPDGINWTLRTISLGYRSSVCWSPERSLFVAVGGQSTVSLSSTGL